MDVIYFETNYRNELIYILTYMEVKNNKIYHLTQEIELSLLLQYPIRRYSFRKKKTDFFRGKFSLNVLRKHL